MIAMLASAFVLGVVVAIPPGSVTIEIGRRAITDGFRSALTFNLGAISADTLYALLVYLGVSSLLAESDLFRLGLWTIGGSWLMKLGWDALWTRLEVPSEASERPHEPFHKGYLAGVGVTLLNPLTILAWISLAGNFFASWESDWGDLSRWGWLALVVMLLGVMSWTLSLMSFLSYVRHWVNPRYVAWVSRGAGLFLILYGLRAWASALEMLLS
jgi:threonine/homoserine/homoserine lactone efflux protein